ncbi:unnamed protein product [Staurois parvus]|uniref:Uncharacterized protein n=1 Tax=Staurois parvus TaxID=386267 RepID=A0ABN9D1D6_9NEOB|nr:unnamed protein product [Staurois parvus]
MGPPGNRGSWGPGVLSHTQSTPKKAYKRYQEHFMGPPTDPGPRANKKKNSRRRYLSRFIIPPSRGRLTTHGAPGQ